MKKHARPSVSSKRPLNVRTETVRVLSTTELGGVVGGDSDQADTCTNKPTHVVSK